jgi:hypothetical protein
MVQDQHSVLLSSPFALAQLASLLLRLAPLGIVATALALAKLDQLEVDALALLGQDHPVVDHLLALRHQLLLELCLQLGPDEVAQLMEAFVGEIVHAVQAALVKWRLCVFELLRKKTNSVLVNGLRVSVVDVDHMIFVGPSISQNLGAIVSIIICEFTSH